MITHNVQQGTPEWLALRANHFTASEAPAMMGVSKYQTRRQLLDQKKTGIIPETTPAQQALFDRGHRAEAAIRPHIEFILQEELFPATGTDGKLLASFDGINMTETKVFEHKLWSEELAENVKNNCLDDHYLWQLDQQLLVSGADEAIFVVSDGTPEKCVYLVYSTNDDRKEQLLRGWEQFEKDLAAHVVDEPTKPAPVANRVESLPALAITLVGEVKHSNLPVFHDRATAVIEAINTNLETDQDFADAEEAVKFCSNAEKELAVVKKQAISQTASIEELFLAMDNISEKLRTKRLTLEKLIKSRKEQIRADVINKARAALDSAIAEANEEFHPIRITGIAADFAGAAKNKRTLDSLRDSVGHELTRATLELTKRRDHVRKSLEIIRGAGERYMPLFRDAQSLVDLAHDHLRLTVEDRVLQFDTAEKARAEEQRAREAAPPPRPTYEPEAKTAHQVAPTPIPQGQQRQPGRTRPTDAQIIEALAIHFRVHESKVIEWLLEMDLEAESEKLASNF